MSAETERFIQLVEKIRAEVNRRAGRSAQDSFKIDEAASCDAMVNSLREKLHYFRLIRNLLQHPQHDTPQRPFLVTPGFLAEVQEVLDRLTNPPRAQSLGISRRDLTFAHPDEKIGDLAARMKASGFSHLPIIDNEHRILGVFNEAAIFAGLCTRQEVILEGSMPLREIIDFCSLDAGHTETFDFVPPQMTKDELLKRFVAVETETTRIGAVFVTKTGKRSEPLQRMITPWDVLSHFHGSGRRGA